MNLQQDQADTLLTLCKSCKLFAEPVPAGGVIRKGSHAQGLNLVIRGFCRVLDHSREFGSQTVLRAEAPYLCGALGLLDSRLEEDVTASTECQVINIPPNESFRNLYQYIRKLVQVTISPAEYPYLKRVIETAGLLIATDQQTPASFQRRWKILQDLNVHHAINGSLLLIYADEPIRGFSYGQILTPETLRQFWTSSDPPRVLYWGSDQSIQQPQSLTDFASSVVHDSAAVTLVSPDQKTATSSVEQHLPHSTIVPRQGPSPHQVKLSRRLRTLGFSPIHGKRSDKRHEAILTMLCQHYKLPQRRDNIRQASSFLSQSSSGSPEDKLLTVLDQFGLVGRTIILKHEDSGRLPAPAVLFDRSKHPYLIVEAHTTGLLCFDPAKGLKQYSTAEIGALIGTSLKAVIVSAGSHTPRRNFSWSWLLPYLLKYKYGLIEVFIASFIAQAFALATPLLFQQIIDRVIGQGASDSLRGFAILMVIFMMLELIFSSLRTFHFMEISNRIDISIGSTIISRLLRLNARYFERKPVGELSSRLNELEKIRGFLTGTALTVVLDATFSLLYFGVMFYYSAVLAGIVLASVPVLLVIIIALTPITQKLIRQRAEAYSKTQSYMVEVLNGIQTVKLQNSELLARRNWEDKHLDGINKGYQAVIANTASSNALQLVNKATNILIITVGAWLVMDNQLSLGGLIAFRIISGYVTQPILRLASTWNQFQEVSLAIERLADIINQPLESSDHESNAISMPPIEGKITFDEVSFSYAGHSKPQLSGVSLTINPGTFTGIVGQSGCGKSTLLKLIPRLYEPTCGKVLIDNFDVTKTELYSLRRQLGFVPQDCLLFEGSIYSNISVAKPDAEAADVIKAAQLACAHDFIMNLPYGYSTPIGEKGAGLSGGQRQRISLARMLLQNPQLLILDEATSALDVDTEQQVITNVRKHTHGRTLLMITHRLSSLLLADQIIVMHEGKVDSVGTHHELMSRTGRYYVLYQQQMGEQ